jgi:hypothetical protein
MPIILHWKPQVNENSSRWLNERKELESALEMERANCQRLQASLNNVTEINSTLVNELKEVEVLIIL